MYVMGSREVSSLTACLMCIFIYISSCSRVMLHVDIPLNRVLSELRKTWLAFKIFPFNLTRIS